ncbi:TPA: hypothetical protein ACPSKB_002978 [Legionella feeleii]
MQQLKNIILLIFLLTSITVNATISRLSGGFTLCVGEYGGNFKIDWKHNVIILTLAGSDTFKIIKETKDSQNNELILTATKYTGDEYLEFKIFSSPSGNFYRALNKDTKEYPYKAAKLSCWNEQ